MPNYDYRCLDCKRRFEVFLTYKEYGSVQVTCRHCGSKNVQRRIGRIRVLRAEDSRLDDLADPALMDGLEDDPKTLGRMMRKMSRELGEEMPPEFDEVVGRLEAGQSPEDIEKELPDMVEDNADLPGSDF